MSSPRRTPASGVAVLLLAAQMVGLLHLVVGSHEVCPLHGDVVEHGAADPGGSVAAGPARAPFTRVVADGRRLHAHDHCLASPGENDADAPEPATEVVSTAPCHSLVSLPVGVVAPRGPPVFRLAPKTSPPA
jgi:hypothetical protein